MKVTEIKGIDTVVNHIKNIGEKSADGVTSVLPTTKVKIAQYPAERNAANDSTRDYNVNDLYKNGLLFSAFNFAGRTTGSLRDFRSTHNTKQSYTTSLTRDALVNILMPRGITDIDTITHKFNSVQDSLVTRGGGTVSGALSSVASHTVFGALESLTQGMMADAGEQIYTAARSMYAGAENRTKTYVWELTPQNVYDLIEIIRIYELFSYYSYGSTGKSSVAKNIKSTVDEWYKSTLLEPLTPEGADKSGTIFESITSFLTNVNVVSNPVIWTIKNFGKSSSFDGRSDVFGPAQIQSIRFDKTPDTQFNGLAIAPNLPSSFVLEVTFREILTLNQSDLFKD